MRVVGADEALQDAAAGRGRTAPGDHQVLQRDRNAEQRRQGVQGGGAGGTRSHETRVGGGGRGVGTFLIQRHPGVKRAVLCVDQGHVRIQQLGGAEIAVPEGRGHLPRVQAGQRA